MYDPQKPYKHDVLKLIEETWKTPHVEIKRGLYPVITKKFSFPEVQHTDGIGTKGFYHWKRRSFENAVIDALAMNLNDLLMVGATPYAIQNHIVLPKDDHRAIFSIIKKLVLESKKRKIAMTGGETSIHFDAVGMDLSSTISGFIKKPFHNRFLPGDILIGLKSDGIHSNGFTKVREIFGKVFRDVFIHPTRIYFEEVLGIWRKVPINGMMHITGGAFTKLKDVSQGFKINIDHSPPLLKPQEIFYEIFKREPSNKMMYSTFNCGVGFVFSVSRENAEKVLRNLKNGALLGSVSKTKGPVLIKSAFNGARVEF